MFRKVNILLALLMATLSVEAQKIDSLQALLRTDIHDTLLAKTYMQLAGELIRHDDFLAELYVDSASFIKAYTDLPDRPLRIIYLKGSIYERRQLFDTASTFFQNILDSKSVIKDPILIAKTNYKLGNMNRRMGNNAIATEYINATKNQYLALGDSMRAADSDVVLGIIYKNSGQYDQAIHYYSSAYEQYKKANQIDPMATCVLNIANVYGRQDRHEDALKKYDEAFDLAQKLDRNQGLLAFIYGNRANSYSQLGKHQEAYDNNLLSYEIRKERARPEEKANSLIGMAISLRELGKPNKALKMLDEALSLSESTQGMLESKERIHLSFYSIYKKEKNYIKAVRAADKYILYKDSLRQTELDKKVLELNEQLETERKEKEIALLNAENELSVTKLNAARLQTYGLLTGLFIVAGLLFSVFRLYRKTQDQNHIISKSLKEKETLLREIHHRVKNNLQFISSLLGLQTEHVSDKAALGALQEGQDRVQSMALIHQNLYQEDNLTGVDLKDYFMKLTRGLFDSYNIRKDQVSLSLDIENVNLDVDSVIPIGLIVNELVSNSLKYAFPKGRNGTIDVSLKESGDCLLLRVKDDGIGMSNEVKDDLGESFGYRLVNVFKDQLKGDLEIQGKEGTSVLLKIRNFEKAKPLV